MVRQVCFYITNKCNLSCSYCKVTKSLSSFSDLPLDKVCKALGIIASAVRPEFLVLFGGEPLIRKDIMQIIHYVHKMKLNYTLITNGTIDNEKAICKLRGLTLSIDRAYSYVAGTNEVAKSNWEMLKKYKDIVPDLVANITVTHENVNELEAIVDKLNEWNIWTIFGLVHSTRYAEEEATFRSYCPKLTLDRDDLDIFKKAFYKAKKRHNTKYYATNIDAFFNQMNWRCSMNPRNPEYLTIANDGTLLACNDFWGHGTPLWTIFDLPKVGMERWAKACKMDREACDLPCWYNHEIQLAYPDEKGYLCHSI